MVCVPVARVDVVNFATPELKVLLPSVVVPSMKVTFPVTVPPNCGVTVAVKVTDCPNFMDSARKPVSLWLSLCSPPDLPLVLFPFLQIRALFVTSSQRSVDPVRYDDFGFPTLRANAVPRSPYAWDMFRSMARARVIARDCFCFGSRPKRRR
jgi:hypothetical protein